MKNETAAGLIIVVLMAYLALPREALAWVVSIVVIGIPAAICLGLVIHTMFTSGKNGLGSN